MMYLSRKILCGFLSGAAVISLATAGAYAQTANPAPPPGAADAARLDQRFDQQERERDWQKLEPDMAEQQVVPMIPEGADSIRFTLEALDIEGMSAYAPEDIAPLYTPYLGQEISLVTLFEIMAEVQRRYYADGYTLTKVFIPNQEIEEGRARLLVVEGYVAAVEMDPAILPSPVMEDFRARILAMRPLNVKTLERLMLILNDLPDLDVSSLLAKLGPDSPEAAEPLSGAVRLILKKNEGAYSHGEISFDNHGSVFIGPYQGSITGRLPHVGRNYAELSVFGVGTTSFQEQKYAQAQYASPIFGASGAMAVVDASYAQTEPGEELDVLDIRGFSKTLSANISYPLWRQRSETLKISAGFEFRNSTTDILKTLLYDDRQRIASVGLNYGFSDRYDGLNVVDVRYSKGLDVMGVREAGSEDLSRADGHPDFDKFSLYAARLQSLPNDWGVYVSVRAQHSAKPLLSSEEFGFGGAQSGRGYNPAELTGDKGVAASVELRWTNPYSPQGFDLQLQHYGFYDAGTVWNIDNNDTVRQSAASAGVGTRFRLMEQWDGDVSLAFPLTREPSSPPPYAESFGPRALFSITRRF